MPRPSFPDPAAPDSTPATSQPRTIVVIPPSRSGESGRVARAAVAILIAALVGIGAHATGGASGDDPRAGLLPYQTQFRGLDAGTQRAYRELQEGTIEAMNARADEKAWPSAQYLAQEGVPPFADVGVDRGKRVWSSARAPFAFQYLGRATRADGTPSLLLRLLEPEPGNLEGQSPNLPLDEQHRRLPDGTLLHVSFWIRAGEPPADEFVRDPAAQGWTQVLSGARSDR